MNLDHEIEMAIMRVNVNTSCRAFDAYRETIDMGCAAREYIADRVASTIKSMAQIRRHGTQAKFNKEIAK